MEREIAITQKQNKMTWLDWVQNILILSAVVIFTLNYTIVGVLKGGWFSPLKNLVMISIFLLFVYRFFTVSKEERRQWFTQKFLRVPSFIWLLAYFIVRCICFAVNGFQYGIAREIFFEFVFLVAICPWTVGPRVRFDIIAWVFCGINLVMNLANTYCYYLVMNFIKETGGAPVENGLLGFLTHLKLYSAYWVENNVGLLYSNPNSAGIMTGLAILMSFLLVQNKKSLVAFAIYWMYSIYVLYIIESRGAMLGFVVSIVSILVCWIFPHIKLRSLIVGCLVICTVIAIGIYGFIGYNLRDDDRTFSRLESQINDISTGRYIVWQNCYRAHKNTKLLGVGSATREKQYRNKQMKRDYIEQYGTEKGFVETTFSVHNGYLAMIFIVGWLNFLLFIFIILDKIKKAPCLSDNKKNSYVLMAIIVFALVVSNFEALLLTSRYYTILIFLLVLSWKNEEEV